MAKNLYQKEYRIVLTRDGASADLGEIARELAWSVNRNPQVGYNKITFKVDEGQFSDWCDQHHLVALDMVTKTKTECTVYVRHNAKSEWVAVVGGYLYKDPTLTLNNDGVDLNFEFIDHFYHLDGWLIPNGTTYTQWYADDLVADIMVNAEADGGWGLTQGERERLAKIDRTYDDWKPASEAISDMLNNETGAGKFDAWIDTDKRLRVAKTRGQDSGLQFHYPYDPTSGQIPMADISYDEPEELATRIVAVGEGQGDAAITTAVEDSDAIAKYGYVTAYIQYSSIATTTVLTSKAQAELDNRLHPDPAPVITVSGLFINWTDFGVGDFIHYTNNNAVFYGLSGDVRVKTIEVTTDENRVETIKLTTEQWDE